jgi:hypothetical protein
VFQTIVRFIGELLGARFRYACLCGWWGNVCSWSDTGDEARTHFPICPHCFSRLK